MSCLKKALGDHQSSQTTLPILDDEGKLVLEPEGILSTRDKKLRSRVITKYLIKWKHFPIEEASWESEAFRQQHPSLCMLWGQSILREEQCYVYFINYLLDIVILGFIKWKGMIKGMIKDHASSPRDTMRLYLKP